MMDPISSQSLVEVQCPVVNREADPRSDVVAIAVLASGVKPTGTTSYVTGSWASESVAPIYLAQVLVGPSSSNVLVAGLYDAWVKVTDNPEIAVLGPYPFEIV